MVKANTPCCIDNPEIIAKCRVQEPSNKAYMSKEPLPPPPPPTQLPPDWNSTVQVAQPVYMPSTALVMGGKANTGGDATEVHAPPLLVKASLTDTENLTYDTLLGEMSSSIDDLTIVTRYASNVNKRASFIRSLDASQVAKLMSYVDEIFDQPAVMDIFAGLIKGFNCDYVLKSMQIMTDYSARVELVKRVGPKCSDWALNKTNIRDICSVLEQMLLESTFL
jgi:hypothetical protein